ncbi:MAG: NfeD family protein [Armatimonadota bacterium]
MQIEAWWVWLILAALLVIGEMLSAGFFLLWFGIGAAIAGVAAYLGVGSTWQWVLFIASSLILFVASRRFADRLAGHQPQKFGAERLVGREGVVIEEVNMLAGTGRVRVEREEWRARSASNAVIPEGAVARIVKVDGTHLVVENGGRE